MDVRTLTTSELRLMVWGAVASGNSRLRDQAATELVRRQRTADDPGESRYAPNSLTPGGWPTDEDGFERFGE